MTIRLFAASLLQNMREGWPRHTDVLRALLLLRVLALCILGTTVYIVLPTPGSRSSTVVILLLGLETSIVQSVGSL